MLARLAAAALLASSLAGCAVEYEEPPEPERAAEDEREPPPSLVEDRPREPWDPCLQGDLVIVGDHAFFVPVACAREEIDKGDPPPGVAAPGAQLAMPGMPPH